MDRSACRTISFADYAASWLMAKSRIKPKTREGYRSLLDSRILPVFGRTPNNHRSALVGSWVRSMTEEGLSASRIRQAHQCLSAILEQAVDDGVIGRNPARRVELPRLDEPSTATSRQSRSPDWLRRCRAANTRQWFMCSPTEVFDGANS
ncbi:MAG: tyrosine-type recombinase/integrase [Acidimicrobiia bacterium]